MFEGAQDSQWPPVEHPIESRVRALRKNDRRACRCRNTRCRNQPLSMSSRPAWKKTLSSGDATRANALLNKICVTASARIAAMFGSLYSSSRRRELYIGYRIAVRSCAILRQRMSWIFMRFARKSRSWPRAFFLFRLPPAALAKLNELQKRHSAAIDKGDMLTVFYTNLHFHQTLFGLCGNSCLIDTIDHLAQKVYGIRSYANAFPDALNRARRDHVAMIEALRRSRRDDLIALTRRHLKPSPEAYIRAYERRFGETAQSSTAELMK